MAATFLGTASVLGVTAQTGMILQSQEEAFSAERKWVVDEAGEKVGMAMWGDELAISLEALVPSSSAFSSRLAASLVLANAQSDFYRGAPSSGFGDTVITGVTRRRQNADFHTFAVQLLASPFMNVA
jgi:hypothetical protein